MEMTDRTAPATKQWRDKIKEMNNAADSMRAHYVTNKGDEDGIFDNEANMMVNSQNDKLRHALKMSEEAKGYGTNTQEELYRINEKLRSVKTKVYTDKGIDWGHRC